MEGLHDLNRKQTPPRDLYDDPPHTDLRSLGDKVLQPTERACCDYYDVKGMMNGVSFSLNTLMDMIQTLTIRVNDVDKVTNSVLTQVTTLKWLTHEMQRKLEITDGETGDKNKLSQFADSLLNDPFKNNHSTPSTVTGSNKKMKTKLPVSGYSDIVLTVPDSENDDDDYIITKGGADDMEFEVVEKPLAPVPVKDKGKRVVDNVTNYRLPSAKGVHIGEEIFIQRSPLTGKTLFPSPPPARVLSMSATIHDGHFTPGTGSGQHNVGTPTAPLAKRKTSSGAAPVVKNGRPYGYTLPRMFKCKFRPTPEMELTQKDVELCAYIFNPDLESTEFVFKCGQTVALRMDLDGLLPGKRISDELMKVFTLKVTWGQYRATKPTVWCLPPSFSEGVQDGVPVEDMVSCFVTRDNWMPAYPHLKYIYAPVRDEDHWYLIVVSIEGEVICHLDSFLPIDKITSRKEHIRNVAEVIATMLQSDSFPIGYMQDAYSMATWDIIDAKGIPNCGKSDDSSIWVIDWIDMEDAFQENLIGVLKEKVVRMRAALSIVGGGHNEMYDSIVKQAMKYWKSVINGAGELKV